MTFISPQNVELESSIKNFILVAPPGMSQLFSHNFYTEMLFSHMVEMLPLMFDIRNHIGWANNRIQEAKLVVAPQPYQTCRLNGRDFFTGKSPGCIEFNANRNMETHVGKFTITKSTIHCQLHFTWKGNFHCFIGTQNRVSLTNTPCSKLF